MLKQRVLTAAILLPLLLAAMFLLPAVWWQLALIVPLLAAGHEWSRLAAFDRTAEMVFLGTLTLGGALLWYAAVPDAAGTAQGLAAVHRAIFVLSCVFWVVIAPCWLWLKLRASNRFALATTGIAVLLPASLALAQLQRDPLTLLLLLGVVWIADTAAYFFGHQFGRRKLAPAISPGKTWEGVAGALATVTVYALIVYCGRWMSYDWQFLAGAFVGMTVFSIYGDLFESWLKRCAGVKDSGTLLPGHGGILDRIDGVVAAMPLAALIFTR